MKIEVGKNYYDCLDGRDVKVVWCSDETVVFETSVGYEVSTTVEAFQQRFVPLEDYVTVEDLHKWINDVEDAIYHSSQKSEDIVEAILLKVVEEMMDKID